MKCPYCGKEIDDYSLTCPECGMNLAIESEPIHKVEVEVVDKPINETMPANNIDANIGLAFSVIGLFINIYCLFSIIGLVFSIKGYQKSKEIYGVGKSKSIAGIICAIVQIIYFISITLVVL